MCFGTVVLVCCIFTGIILYFGLDSKYMREIDEEIEKEFNNEQ